ncbi:MAG: CAP domain-containing protein [Saprospiraceae bacterium]|nr:CAP domain-containing protein [Bacteroidia bacterium]NNE15825.1 CAP domain-containing protein [Saprospiraceae bacterium]NNL91770.1 CAP domain-containing protein [Saprospiraceae bacterium]
MVRLTIILFAFTSILFSCSDASGQRVKSNIKVSEAYMLKKVNQLRAKGCKCGRTYYESAPTLKWSETLEGSAMSHAREMDRYNYFGHQSVEGKDIGQRLDLIGYKWQYAGENLAVGQKSFDEAFRDWIKSPTHCKMLMNANMTEMGISRYSKYWVQHFGKQMPPKTKRVNVRYREG